MNTIEEKNALKLDKKLDKEIVSILKQSKIENKIKVPINELTYSLMFTNKFLIIILIREGIPYSLFNLIKNNTPFNEDDWSQILEISTRTLHRYKLNSSKFKSIQSEKILEIAEVTNIGLEVFGNMEKLKLWLDTPNYALGRLKPIELLKDSYGKDMVIGELTRINHGIFV